MSDTLLNQFLAQGTNTERLAFVPDPATPAVGPDPGYIWWETDTGDTYAWDIVGAAWVLLVASSPGTVSTVSVASANGFAGSVANPTTTPAITISTSVTGILYGNGTAVAAAIAANFPTLNQNTTGSAATLTTPRNINGVAFNGSADITVTAAAGTLTGTTLNATVVTSSLTALGTIATGVWQGTAVGPVYGGTGLTSYAAGDLLYASATNVLSRLAAGTDTFVLTMTGGVPVWAAAAGGGGTPGGSTTQLQYNNAGAFGGISGATTNGTATTYTASNLIATSPRFVTGINDTNGNELFLLTATASAVNELTVANAATGNNPTISATGSNTDIGINLTVKGTGSVVVSGPISVTTSVAIGGGGPTLALTGATNTLISGGTNYPIIITPNGTGTFQVPKKVYFGDAINTAASGRDFNVIGTGGGIALIRTGSAAAFVEIISRATAASADIAYWDIYVNSNSSSLDDLTFRSRVSTNDNVLRLTKTQVYVMPTTAATSTTNGALRVDGGISLAGSIFGGGTITTAAPAGASAHPWLLGSVVAGAVTPDATQSVFVTINGSVRKLIIAA